LRPQRPKVGGRVPAPAAQTEGLRPRTQATRGGTRASTLGLRGRRCWQRPAPWPSFSPHRWPRGAQGS